MLKCSDPKCDSKKFKIHMVEWLIFDEDEDMIKQGDSEIMDDYRCCECGELAENNNKQ